MTEAFCCEASVASGESIVASAAAETSVWLVLEYRAAWADKAPEKAELPPAVRERWDAWVAGIARCRPQLIRRPRSEAGPLSFFVACSRPGRQRAVRFALDRYEDLLEIDVPGLVAALEAGTSPPQGEELRAPLLLVCTHGKRDRCCAKWGIPVYERAETAGDFDVWQTSHLGGHRFAATLVVLPQGLCYGRVLPDEVDALLEASRRGEVWRLDRFRGRTALTAPAMAAEHLIRAQTGETREAEVTVETVDALGEHRFRARGRVGDRPVEVELEWRRLSSSAPPSCGKPPEPVRAVDLLRFTGAEP